MIELEKCDRFLPQIGQKYYTPTFSEPMEINVWEWNGGASDRIAFNQGVVFETRKQSIKFHKAYRELIQQQHTKEGE